MVVGFKQGVRRVSGGGQRAGAKLNQGGHAVSATGCHRFATLSDRANGLQGAASLFGRRADDCQCQSVGGLHGGIICHPGQIDYDGVACIRAWWER
ncbi:MULTISPECIES: hypothetical protein [Enterobacterales]|uniref:Uncharacterized protein n=1 Tax=Candidatus Sodalis endolongispinus TaxID=2812662 RepID=A0ABS5YC66_9GAMM|nr:MULTISPECIES: hypothetical protein [Enterobacterales]MBG6247520.1 hypothetical protein [Candidatus Symbiopectobacterium sp. PLON1]MBT9432601.1 hypothetical protein [Candidatus Sodalis endolongispinus]